MSWIDPVEKLPTRQLLEYLKLARKCGGWYSPLGPDAKVGYSIEVLKMELATREHVPNKPEARARRQAAARGRGRDS